MAESKKIAPGQVIAGRYRVIREIGRGAVGSVHLVQHVHTDEQFALKVLHDPAAASPEKIARFRVEARAPARIGSDHVVRISDADVSPELGGAPFFVMEYLRGHDLGVELDTRGSLPPEEVVLYMRQASRALDKAHALGIIHRDLKPENLFLTEREDRVPCIKLVDWGIAKLTGDAATIAQIVSRTQTGRIFGTPLFMSPEQATGRVSLVGPATDVWALGLVVNRLLTGRDHFESDTVAELIGKISYDPIKPPSAYGSIFGGTYDAWFLKCCNREISKRFRTAGEAVTDLAFALGIEEGDALIDAVVSSRRAAADMALRETLRAPKIAAAATQEIGTIEIDVVVPAPPPLPALAPPPVPPAMAPASPGLSKPDTPPATPSPGLSRPSTPAAPPIADVQRPSTPGEPPLPGLSRPSAPAEPPSTGPGSASALVRTTFDDEGPRGSTLRSVVVFSVAVVCALAVGLGFGLLFLKGNSSSSGADPDTSSSAPGSAAPSGSSQSPAPAVPASSSTNSPGSTASAAPSASAAPTSPRSGYRGDPLKWRK